MTVEAPVALVWPLVAIGGLILGSFLNVVALRWHGDRGVSRARPSHCVHCDRRLRWYELIPLLSFLIQGGRCRSCRRPISLRYPLVELGTALVAALIVETFGFNTQALILGSISAVLIIVLLIDLESMILPDQLTLSVLILSVIGLVLLRVEHLTPLTVGGDWQNWLSGALVGLAAIGGLYLITRGRGMGLGDVKLATVLGVSLGSVGMVVCLAVAFMIGAIVGVILLLQRRATLKTAVPFGPFLILGWWVTVLWGPEIVAWYTNL